MKNKNRNKLTILEKLTIIAGLLVLAMTLFYPRWAIYAGPKEVHSLRASLFSSPSAVLKQAAQKLEKLSRDNALIPAAAIDYKAMGIEFFLIVLSTRIILMLVHPKNSGG